MKNPVCVFLLTFLFLALLVTSVYAKESIEITCYLGDLSDNLTPGDIDVFDIADATKTCNMAYEDCEGKCIGCYINKDGLEICIDNKGKKFKKE